MIEDEIIHWWKDEKGEQHRTILRLESEKPSMFNGFPRDGVVVVRLVNTIGQIAIKLSPEEALKISHQIMGISKDLMYMKRQLWHKKN